MKSPLFQPGIDRYVADREPHARRGHKQHDNPGAQVSHSIPHLHIWSELIPEPK
jgi:hypothetical protein